MVYALPPLPYAYNALEPYMDEQTLRIHHGKHHQTYVDKLNVTLQSHEELAKKPVEELLKDLQRIPEGIRTGVINFGGGHANHSFFWPLLKKDGGVPQGNLAKQIEVTFGSFEKFREQFSAKAAALFGSGYTWLVLHRGTLDIINLPNQDSPLSQGKTPLLVVDVWEHAYYLKYQNRRTEFVENFFKIINWDTVSEHFKNAKGA